MLFHSETKIALFYLLLFPFIRFHLLYHPLSFVVIPYHLLSLVVPFVNTRCTTLCRSLSLVALLVVTYCHFLSLVVTWCTTRLSFYKRSWFTYDIMLWIHMWHSSEAHKLTISPFKCSIPASHSTFMRNSYTKTSSIDL